MTRQLKGSDLLILWRLAVVGGEDWQKDIKPTISKAVRERLAKEGLIEAVSRKGYYLSLTDYGWDWLGKNMDADLKSKSPAGNETFARMLKRLKTFLDAKQFTLADILPLPNRPPDGGLNNLERRIVAACFQLSRGEPNVRVRLADLRTALADVPRERLDAALLELASNGRASLYRLDNPLEIHSEDRESVLRTPSGEERHIIYLGGLGS